MRRMKQNRFPPQLQQRLEKMQNWNPIITNNCLEAVMLIVFGYLRCRNIGEAAFLARQNRFLEHLSCDRILKALGLTI